VLVEILEATLRAKSLLDAIERGTLTPHVSLINIAEAEYVVCRKVGHSEARRRVESLIASGYYAIEDSPALHEAAAELKCERAISFVDCYTFAVAELTSSVPMFASEEAEIVREMKRKPFKLSPSFLPSPPSSSQETSKAQVEKAREIVKKFSEDDWTDSVRKSRDER
jgi:predicted nucleic acid-binding protein